MGISEGETCRTCGLWGFLSSAALGMHVWWIVGVSWRLGRVF